MEQEIEDPLKMCLAWVQLAVPRTSPQSLTRISLNKVKEMITTYPNIREDNEKLSVKRGLKNLLDLPIQFVPDLLSFVLSALQYTAPRGADNCYPALDLFLLSQILHPSVSKLDMAGLTGLPSVMRNILIRNLSRMTGIRHLTLSTSMDIPWSMFFSQSQTSRFMSSIENLQTLIFQDYADDVFVMEIGQHCFNLGTLDVQGSVSVTDQSLMSLSELLKLRHLDVARTGVTPSYLASFLQKMPGVTSLGSWDDFNFLLDNEVEIHHFNEISVSNVDIESLMFSTLSNLSKLRLKMTNSSQKLHILGSLLNLSELELADLNYRQSRLDLAIMGLSSRLRNLALDHVYGWDTTDLRAVGQYCSQLESFTVSNCTIDNRNVPSEQEKKVRYFPTLRKLTVSSNVSHSQFLVMTGHASQLSHLQTGVNCWVTTRLLSHLLKLNSLEQLKYLRIDCTKNLCPTVLFLLLKNAKSLQYLIGVETWQKMDPSICDKMNLIFEKKNLPHRLNSFANCQMNL